MESKNKSFKLGINHSCEIVKKLIIIIEKEKYKPISHTGSVELQPFPFPPPPPTVQEASVGLLHAQHGVAV